jgi:hypothetical protein
MFDEPSKLDPQHFAVKQYAEFNLVVTFQDLADVLF